MEIEREFWEVNGVRLHVAAAGSGSPVVLLHGFPEFWYSWRHIIPALADRYRVIAPDLRGYGQSEAPARGYDLFTLGRDVAELLTRADGGRPVRLVGHDWGGVIGWHVAASYPSLVERYVTVAGPHPARHLELMGTDLRQFLMSAYILFFQVPLAPERLLSWRRGAVLVRTLKTTMARTGALTEEDLELYRAQWSRRDRLRAGLNYYRALRWDHVNPFRYYREHPVSAPVLAVWGDRDRFLSRAQTRGLEKWCGRAPAVKIIPECGHWVAQEAPEELAEILLDFFEKT